VEATQLAGLTLAVACTLQVHIEVKVLRLEGHAFEQRLVRMTVDTKATLQQYRRRVSRKVAANHMGACLVRFRSCLTLLVPGRQIRLS